MSDDQGGQQSGQAGDGTDRLRITEADVSGADIDQRVEAMAEAQKVALVRTVGTAPSSGGSSTLRAILVLTGGGAVGGLLAFLGTKALDVLPVTSDLVAENSFFSNMSFTFMLALFIGAGVSLADVALNRSWAKLGNVAVIALPAAVGGALVMGLIAHFFYSTAIDWLYSSAFDQLLGGELTEAEVEDYVLLRLHPIRGLAWLLVGVSAGIAAGAAARSWRRLALAATGGAIGGFLGGFVFDFIATSDSNEWIAQAVGIVLLGTLIGTATGLIEQATKSRWIEIASGGLAGKQFILYKQDITLGSSPSADITLIKDASIAPIAAMLQVRGQGCSVSVAPGTGPVLVNGTQVAGSAAVGDMDLVTIGATQVRFRERASSGKTPGALRA